jgi:hypothetical protein
MVRDVQFMLITDFMAAIDQFVRETHIHGVC